MKYLFFVFFLLHASNIFSQESTETLQLRDLDFQTVTAEITIYPGAEKVSGTVSYAFEVLQPVDSFYLDARQMQFEKVSLNGVPVKVNNTGNRLWVLQELEPEKEHLLRLDYSAYPKQSMYFINWNAPAGQAGYPQVWTQGQGKDTSHWLPVVDDLREKSIFNLTVAFRNGYEVIANGQLLSITEGPQGYIHWEYRMENPMSSYLLAIAAGEYQKRELLSSSGVPIGVFYETRDTARVEPTYRHSREIFDFLEQEIGLAYPWENYKQVPVQDFLHSGMENTGTTLFSRAHLTDSIGFKDRNYIRVNAHELAHQWFGNLVTRESGEHHWLHEGFATYYALLAEKEIFGEDHFYWQLYESAEQLKALSDQGKGESLMNPRAGSLTFYQKGAWALHILRERIGDTAFKTAVRNFLNNHAYHLATTADFVVEAEEASGEDLADFKADWLTQTAFQGTQALASLKRSAFITDYLEIAALRETPLLQKRSLLEKALDFPVNDYTGQEVVFQLAGESGPEAMAMYRKAFKTGNVFVRQAIALSMEEIPGELRSRYESLLADDSWLTREVALTKLWMQFPRENSTYLEQTRGQEGFVDKNLRILWLTLNLATPSFEPDKKEEVYKELSGYTASLFDYGIRQTAFGYLYQINAFSDQNLEDLLEGCHHPVYRFREFCRQLLSTLLKDPEYFQRFTRLRERLERNQQDFLEQQLRVQE